MSLILAGLRQWNTRRDRAVSSVRHHRDVVFLRLIERLNAYGDRDLSELRVLEFGCGYKYPLVAGLEPTVRSVTGLDVVPFHREGPLALAKAYAVGRKGRGFIHGLLEYADARAWYDQFQQTTGRQVDHAALDLHRYGGGAFPFPDASFDLIVSNAVLQELPGQLEAFASEMSRVLAPGGRIDLEWHNFYSWSGHYRDLSSGRELPWGHLLDEGRSYHRLNRLTPPAVLEAFAGAFEDMRLLRHDRQHRIAGRDPDFEPEEEDLLTPELAARLCDIPREWLLTRGYILQACKRESAPVTKGKASAASTPGD